ncbi:MAG: hypothetical protein EA392_06170 [Cryomorphaceae bacterium]|nr:MAG: hypothetical protein EA392_06170 [Cryomorphaceae bacterium]
MKTGPLPHPPWNQSNKKRLLRMKQAFPFKCVPRTGLTGTCFSALRCRGKTSSGIDLSSSPAKFNETKNACSV